MERNYLKLRKGHYIKIIEVVIVTPLNNMGCLFIV